MRPKWLKVKTLSQPLNICDLTFRRSSNLFVKIKCKLRAQERGLGGDNIAHVTVNMTWCLTRQGFQGLKLSSRRQRPTRDEWKNNNRNGRGVQIPVSACRWCDVQTHRHAALASIKSCWPPAKGTASYKTAVWPVFSVSTHYSFPIFTCEHEVGSFDGSNSPLCVWIKQI